jgi:predicted DNA-binding ribbon-helix-helix protein
MGAVRKRSVSINGHRTSYSLEDAFQQALEQIAAERGIAPATLVAEIDAKPRREGGLSSALRLHVLESLLNSLAELRSRFPTA